jgi:hypothetical protein
MRLLIDENAIMQMGEHRYRELIAQFKRAVARSQYNKVSKP